MNKPTNDCTIVHNDSYGLEFTPDVIISDPPYDITPARLHSFMAFWPEVTTVLFCPPENQYFTPDEYLFWIKTPSTKNYSRRCGRFVEMILVKHGENHNFNQLHWSQMTGVYDDRLITKPVHPHEKPLSLMERLIRIYTNPGDVVFDPFMGSGTTGVAARNLDRKFIGIEKDEKWFALAKERVEG